MFYEAEKKRHNFLRLVTSLSTNVTFGLHKKMLTKARRTLFKSCQKRDYTAIERVMNSGLITGLDFPCFCNNFIHHRHRHSFLDHFLRNATGFGLATVRKLAPSLSKESSTWWMQHASTFQLFRYIKTCLSLGMEVEILKEIASKYSQELEELFGQHRGKILRILEDFFCCDIASIIVGYVL